MAGGQRIASIDRGGQGAQGRIELLFAALQQLGVANTDADNGSDAAQQSKVAFKERPLGCKVVNRQNAYRLVVVDDGAAYERFDASFSGKIETARRKILLNIVDVVYQNRFFSRKETTKTPFDSALFR